MEVHLVKQGDEFCYIILSHPEGYTAYCVDDVGGEMKPIAHDYSPQDLAQTLSTFDSDSSVGLHYHYSVTPLTSKEI